MARGEQQRARQVFGETQDIYNTANSRGSQLYNTLFPQYVNEAQNPQGFTKGDYGKMVGDIKGGAATEKGDINQGAAAENTAAQQSVGGALSSAKGEGDLLAARTRNSGSFAPALDTSVKHGMDTLSNDALDVQAKKYAALLGVDENTAKQLLSTDTTNAGLRESNRQAGMAGESSLYNSDTAQMMQSLGLGTNAVNAATDAGKSGWFQNMIATINALKPTASAGGGQPASVGIG